MKITVFPRGVFIGEVYIKGKKDQDGCKFSYASGDTGPLYLEVKDEDCGGVIENKVCIVYILVGCDWCYLCDSGYLCRYFNIYPVYSAAFVV